MNSSSKPVSLLDSQRHPRALIWMIAWPAIVDQLLQTAVQYVDSAMLGSLGALATAAVAANSSTIWLVHGVVYALGAGFAVLSARALGANDQEQVDKIVLQALLSLLTLGVMVMLLFLMIAQKLPYWLRVEEAIIKDTTAYMSYIAFSFPFTIAFMFIANLLRSSGDTKSPMIANISANLFNVVGNFFLIFPTRSIELFGRSVTIWGADLGVSGAAIASALANCLAGTILLIVLFTSRGPIRVNRQVSWRPEKSTWKQVFSLSGPLAMERASISLGQVALTALVSTLGTTALAAHHLAIVAESITYMPVSGFSIAATTLVAQSLGAKQKEQALDFAQRTLLYGVLLMSVTGALMFIFAKPLMSFFTPDKQVVALGASVLRLEAFAEPFFALAIVGSGILRGSGDTRWPFLFSLIGMWGVRILPASILLLGFNFGLQVAWACMVCDLIVRGVLTLRRFLQRRWLEHSSL